MPGIAPPCANPVGCRHPEAVHLIEDVDPAIGPRATKCRVTGCLCDLYQEPAEEPEEPAAEPKRLVIEIPDGFAVTVQLMPLEVTGE